MINYHFYFCNFTLMIFSPASWCEKVEVGKNSAHISLICTKTTATWKHQSLNISSCRPISELLKYTDNASLTSWKMWRLSLSHHWFLFSHSSTLKALEVLCLGWNRWVGSELTSKRWVWGKESTDDQSGRESFCKSTNRITPLSPFSSNAFHVHKIDHKVYVSLHCGFCS